VLVLQHVQQLPDGLVEYRVLQVGSEIGQRTQHEPALVHEQVRNVQVLGAADHAIVVEQDVDVERPGLVALGLRRAPAPLAAQGLLDRLQPREQRGGRPGRSRSRPRS